MGVTHAGAFLGTIDYCSPEQIRGEQLDGRADVYSFGCVLCHCLSGEPPYIRETEFAVLHAHLHDPPPALSTVRPGLPRALDGVIARGMAKEPEARYPTAGALAAALGNALGRTDAEATRTAPTVSANRVRHIRRWLLAAVILVVALGVTAVAVLATRGSHNSPPASAKLRTFVDRIENVLQQSADGRHEIAAALAAGFNCSVSPHEAGQRIASVADNRQSILEQLGTLQTPTPQADDVVTVLQQALQQSIEADRHYRDGFFAVQATRCPLPTNSSFRLAAQSDARATTAKKQFVAAFDPLAARFGRRTWSEAEI